MTIKISRNASGNCLNFLGSSLPAYFNSCLSGAVDSDAPDTINVVNDIQTANNPNGEIRYEFYQIPYTQFADKDGNSFASAQEAADYITNQGNVIGSSGIGADLTGVSVSFRLDSTSTSIIMDNGASYGVNTIKAVPNVDGTIHIHSIGAGDPNGVENANENKYFEKLDHTLVSINGSPVAGGLNDVANALNELFTVGAFESVVISDPYSTMIADVNGTLAGYTLVGSTAVDPIGNDIFGNTGSGNYAGLLSIETIDQAGEYYTFDIRGEGTIGFGLVHTQDSYDNGHFSGNSNYADPTSFAVSNSAHYGYQFSHWFHPTPNGSWTNYGANTGYSMRPGWSNWNQQADWLAGNPVKIRCGIDTNGYISIESLQDDGTWVVHARTSYPVAQGSKFRLGVKSSSASARVYSAPMVHLLEPAAPVMYFRYIESPDGYYDYPLFATQEESDYYELTEAGADNGSHTHVYVDDPTSTTWYMPNTSHNMSHGLSPVGQNMTLQGNAINWTEITSLTNADLVPPTFNAYDLTVSEDASVNYQTQPVDTAYVTTFTNIPAGLVDLGSGMIGGTAPTVADDNVTNPSDSYVIDVIRTNSYGSSTGQLTLIVNNLTAPATVPAGFTLEHGSVNGDGSLASDSVVSIDGGLEVGKRYVVPTSWINTNVLSQIDELLDKAYFGVPAADANWSEVDLHNDFDAVMRWEWTNEFYHKVSLSVGGGPDANHVTIMSSPKAAYYHQAIEWDGTDLIVIRTSDLADLTSRHVSELDPSKVYKVEGYTAQSGTLPLVFATKSGGSMLITTSGMQVIDTPAEPSTPILTPWTKALDFSGSSERAQMVSNSSSWLPLRMRDYSSLVPLNADTSKTASYGTACPWATAIVFRSDLHNSNQHIWNLGEGAGTNDDNIYLRQGAAGTLHFGWGRDGALNECAIGNANSSTGWHGLYIAHTGARFNSSDATAANLADAFSIRRMGSEWAQPFGSLGSELSTTGNWVTTGGRMDRKVEGDFTIGGRGSNRSFHGKIASMVLTTLELDTAMPDDDEAKMLITDPVRWIQDYREGGTFRMSGSNTGGTWNAVGGFYHSTGVQMWLMGDTSTDSYSNMIRNYVYPSDQNYTKLNLISMVSNDIQNVTIPGLTS